MPAPSASGFDLLCRNTTIATADRQQTNATTITALVVARMPKFIVGPQPVGTSRVFPQPARESRRRNGYRFTYNVLSGNRLSTYSTVRLQQNFDCVAEIAAGFV